MHLAAGSNLWCQSLHTVAQRTSLTPAVFRALQKDFSIKNTECPADTEYSSTYGSTEPTGICSWRQAFFHACELLCVGRYQPCACICLFCARQRTCSAALLHRSRCLRRQSCALLQVGPGPTLLGSSAYSPLQHRSRVRPYSAAWQTSAAVAGASHIGIKWHLFYSGR